MSIVTFTGTDANGTVGHGLFAPDVMLIKIKEHQQIGLYFIKVSFDTDNTAYINLNTTDGKSQSASVFQSTAYKLMYWYIIYR